MQNVRLKNPFFLFIVLTFSVLPVHFASPIELPNKFDRFKELMGARSLKCTFGPGAMASWESGEPVISNGEFNVTIHFDAIDLKTGKARQIGNQGAVEVLVYPSPSGISFIEETGSGNMVFTTVFSNLIKGSNDFVGVTSRHMEFFGQLLPSQYHGTCQIWDLFR